MRLGGAAGVAFAPPKAPPKARADAATASTAAKALVASTREVVEREHPAPASGEIHGALAARRLIRTGDLWIELTNYEEGARRAEEVATSLGGYVATARVTSTPAQSASGTVALRVPADRFSEAIRRLDGLGKVRSRDIRAEDVSKEYLDLETRLRVERDAEARMREVLRNRPAKLSDIVEAEQELTRIVEEIETMEAQRLLYDRQIELATINLNLSEPEAPKVATAPSVFAPIGEAFRDAGFRLSVSVAGMIIAATVALPWLALAALLVLLVRRLRPRRPAASPSV